MEIKVVEPAAGALHVAFGISEERSNEISKQIDIINGEHFAGPDRHIYALLVSKIAKICETNEELVYAITNNYNWLIMMGKMKIL